MAMQCYCPPTTPWIEVVLEDQDIVIVNKPAGLLSVPGREKAHYDSMWSRLIEHYPEIAPVHRLDMCTSGIMLFAKNKAAESALKKQFQFRLTHKVYYARVWGEVKPQQGLIDLPLICDWPNRPRQKVCFEHGKPSQTQFEVVEREQGTTMVRLFPITGRSHQLRVHMQALGYPIVGDEFYAQGEAFENFERLGLHATELSFYHPKDNKLCCIFVPCDFYPQASSIIQAHFSPADHLPDYKTLPRP
ncbi:ribosomal large subunit pseudouridine synthase A [Vibrio zhanjiangensis]|uniref:Pseudouridine synthase n=1 Tax=Vibrio zhanjiangensis TaxID=1046128 RepID=A0ABQ6F340_9VIBR|nr:RluA family pseudouridine synthase [Vibrio zhanjiangensis]GLT19948.1 ribosomal large subunit pseudouridine synthase A [Vibrio zhanjiangensis]